MLKYNAAIQLNTILLLHIYSDDILLFFIITTIVYDIYNYYCLYDLYLSRYYCCDYYIYTAVYKNADDGTRLPKFSIIVIMS